MWTETQAAILSMTDAELLALTHEDGVEIEMALEAEAGHPFGSDEWNNITGTLRRATGFASIGPVTWREDHFGFDPSNRFHVLFGGDSKRLKQWTADNWDVVSEEIEARNPGLKVVTTTDENGQEWVHTERK